MKIRFRPLIIAAAVLATGGCSLFRSTISPELRSLGFRATLREEQCILTAANGSTLTITPGSTRTLFNGTIVHLPEPAFRDAEGRISLTPLSLQKTVEPLLNRRTGNARPVKRILLDPGHGGAELGAVGKSCQEKALNLALSLAVKRELEKRGYTVLMTRAKDQAVSLDRRGKLTGELRADLFLSIHHNASPSNPKATGIETYALTPGGAASTSGGNPGKAGYRRTVSLDNDGFVRSSLPAQIQASRLPRPPVGKRVGFSRVDHFNPSRFPEKKTGAFDCCKRRIHAS